MSWASDEFLRDIPKCDLHVHLDGSLRINTLIELAQKNGVELPSYSEEELGKTIFSGEFSNLEEYLLGFHYTCAVMTNTDAMERIAYEFAVDNYEEGVRYFEVRFAPQLHASMDASQKFSMRDVTIAVNQGLKRAKEEYNQKLVDCGAMENDPFYDYGIIACAMRMLPPGPYFDALRLVHPDVEPDRLSGMASEALICSMEKCRDEDGVPVVALDVAGAEDGFPNKWHKVAFDRAHASFFNKTAHAGEGYGPESIYQAIRDLHAERIGHGFHLFSSNKVSKDVTNPQEYVRKLTKFVCDRRICLEVCPTSNLGTMPGLKLEDHPLGKMVNQGVSVTVNTDNRLVSQTDTVKELRRSLDALDFTPKQLREIVINGIKRSFFHDIYPVKRKYIRKFMNYYDKVAEKHDIQGKWEAYVASQGGKNRARAESASLEHNKMFGVTSELDASR